MRVGSTFRRDDRLFTFGLPPFARVGGIRGVAFGVLVAAGGSANVHAQPREYRVSIEPVSTVAEPEGSEVQFRLSARHCRVDEPAWSPCRRSRLPNGHFIKIRLAIRDAAGPADFIPLYLDRTPQSISIPERARSVILTLPTQDSDVHQPDGQVTVTVLPPGDLEFSGQLSYRPHPTLNTARKTITDNDTPATRIVLTGFPDRVTEGEIRTLAMRVELDGAARADTTYVDLSAASGTARESLDFGKPNRPVVAAIPARQRFAVVDFGVLAVDDSIFEGDETFLVTATNERPLYGGTPLPVTPARITITDGDVASSAVVLTMSPETISEKHLTSVRVTATLDQSAQIDPLEVTVKVTGDSADADYFEPIPDFRLTIPAERLSGTRLLGIKPVNDSVAGGDKTLRVSGTSALPVIPATVTILDDETASTAIALTVRPESVPENGSQRHLVRVTATLNEAARPEPTEIVLRAEGGTAGADDFGPISDFRLRIPAGASSGTTLFPIFTTDDGIAEGDETVVIRGVESPLPVQQAALRIADDEVASDSFTLAADPPSVTESAGPTPITVSATVNRDPGPDDVELKLLVGASTAVPPEDFTALGVSETYVVAGGRRLPVAVLPLTIPADGRAERRRSH